MDRHEAEKIFLMFMALVSKPHTERQMNCMVDSIIRMSKNGIVFTPDLILSIVDGDNLDNETLYGEVPGYKKLNKCLGEIMFRDYVQ